MSKKSRLFIGVMLIALFSQLYLDLLFDDFRVSCGVIAIAIFIHTNQDINTITVGITSAASTFLWRVIVLTVFGLYDQAIVVSYIPEMFFYVGYGVFMHFTSQKHSIYTFDLFAILAVVCDFTMNLLEVVVRVAWFNQHFFSDILTTLLFVAVIRSAIVLIILIMLRYQKILLLKEEHDIRYKRLLWLNSFLRTEIFWMENNMERIEQIMTQAYKHFEDIRDNKNQSTWSTEALNLAGSVHEIKKEYELVIRGVHDLMENKYQNQTMTFYSVLSILEEQMRAETADRSEDIRLSVHGGSDFETINHFQLMSIFRNLIVNSCDAAKGVTTPVTIKLTHWVEGEFHKFQVTDNGPGISPENLPFISTPGFSTKIDYQTGFINRGLGLTIVYRLIEDVLCGSITVTSVPNTATTFDIVIPKVHIEVQH